MQKFEEMKKNPLIAICACGGVADLRCAQSGFYVCCENAPEWYTPATYRTQKKAIDVWNAMQKNMDDLARDAMISDHQGISYGKYIPIKGKIPSNPKPKETVYPNQCKRKYCAICGGEIPQGTLRRKYCDGVCADVAVIRHKAKYKKSQKIKK